jgi:hypothetical protein
LQITLFKKSKFEPGPEEIIQPEILAELVIKIVETNLPLSNPHDCDKLLELRHQPSFLKTKYSDYGLRS